MKLRQYHLINKYDDDLMTFRLLEENIQFVGLVRGHVDCMLCRCSHDLIKSDRTSDPMEYCCIAADAIQPIAQLRNRP
jgi:hypothetical protein